MTKQFKCYFYPNSSSTNELDNYLKNAHGSEIKQIVIAVAESYPFWEMHDETDLAVEVHYPYDGHITLTPIPTDDAQETAAKKTRVRVGNKKANSDA